MASLKRTIGLLLERGRFRQAADRQSKQYYTTVESLRSKAMTLTEEIAQIYQQDGSDLQAAMDAYEQAGEWYAGEDSTA